MTAGAWVLVIAVVAAIGFGLYRASVDGRFTGTRRLRGIPQEACQAAGAPEESASVSVLDGSDVDHDLGTRATLLQFSSAFCAPCRVTRHTLGEVAAAVPGVVHIEIDAEHHLDLVRRLGVLRTPTTLILDAAGREVTRAAGAPRKEQVLSALAQVAP